MANRTRHGAAPTDREAGQPAICCPQPAERTRGGTWPCERRAPAPGHGSPPAGGEAAPQTCLSEATRAEGRSGALRWMFSAWRRSRPSRPSVSSTRSAPRAPAYRPHAPVPLPSSKTAAPATASACARSHRQRDAAAGHTVPPTESRSPAPSERSSTTLCTAVCSSSRLSPSRRRNQSPEGRGGMLTG